MLTDRNNKCRWYLWGWKWYGCLRDQLWWGLRWAAGGTEGWREK